MERVAYLNREIVSESESKISIFDHAMHVSRMSPPRPSPLLEMGPAHWHGYSRARHGRKEGAGR